MSVVALSKKLFALPNARILSVIYLIDAIFSFLLDQKALIFLLIITATILCSIKLLSLRFNLRRVLFLSILVSALGNLSFIISGSFTGSFFLLLAVMYFCSEKGFLPSAFASAIPFLILEPNYYAMLFLCAVLFFIYLRILSVRIKNSTLREFVENFVKFWLTNNPEYAEKILIKNSEIFKGRVRCLRMNEFKLISSDFHPGPFRNVGGAKLVNFLELPNSAYLHSPTHHERDPVSEEDLKKICKALNCDGVEILPMEPFELESRNFKVFCFPFDKIKLIFVSGKSRIDDFVIDSENFVVDCHNANFYGDLNSEEIEEIRDLVEKAEKMDSEKVSMVEGSFIKLNVSSESICNYISAILLDYGFEKFAIVIFDSNNIDLSFRKLVEKRFAELGFKAIVCSTDNHSKTGIRVRESYKPAGVCKEDYEFLDLLLENAKKARFERVYFCYSESTAEVRVLGNVIKEIEDIAGSSGRYIFLFFIFIILGFILSVVSKAI